jgi:DNA-binding CsgD family transcriptional regulator
MLSDSYKFSERERDVVKLLLQGKSNKQIALELGISNRTVEFHLSNIYAKLEVSSRTGAILKLAEGRLRESTGDFPVKSTVYEIADSTENGFKSTSRRISMKKLYYGVGGLLAAMLIASIVLANLPTDSFELLPRASIGQTQTRNIDTPVAILPALTETLQPANIVHQSHTVNGYTATVESYYVDTSHIIFNVRIMGGNITFGNEHFYGRVGSPDLYDEYGNLINAGGGFGPAVEDPTLIQMKFEPVTLLTGNRLKGQLAFEINNAPAYDETLAQFRFDFDIPIYPEVRFNPKQVITANGVEILLDSIAVTPTFTQIYLCFQPPTFAPWNIGSESILQIGEQNTTPYDSRLLFNSAVGGDKRGASEPYWVPPTKNGICMKNGFAVGSANPSSLTLIIPDLEADADAGAILLTNQLAMDYPDMSPKEAYNKFLEEQGKTYKGPWVFTVELKP